MVLFTGAARVQTGPRVKSNTSSRSVFYPVKEGGIPNSFQDSVKSKQKLH